MIIEQEEVMSFFEENDVKFIRLAFSDAFSVQKNISIMPSEMKIPFGVSAARRSCAWVRAVYSDNSGRAKSVISTTGMVFLLSAVQQFSAPLFVL